MGKGKEFLIETTPFLIGRGEEISLNRSSEGMRLDLPDPTRSISRKHAKIIVQSGTYQIVDTSVNGTLLNGKKVSFGDLENNSTIEMGIGEGALMFEFILPQKEESFSISRPTPPPRPQPVQPSRPLQPTQPSQPAPSYRPTQPPHPPQPSQPSQPFQPIQPSQGNPFLEFTKISHHFRKEESESYGSTTTVSWKWLAIITIGILLLFFLILILI